MRSIRVLLAFAVSLLAVLSGCLDGGSLERFEEASFSIRDTIAVGTADVATKTYPFTLPAGMHSFTVRQAYDWSGWHEAVVHTDRGPQAGFQLTAGTAAERCASDCPSHRIENLDGVRNWFLTVRVQALDEGRSDGKYSFGISY